MKKLAIAIILFCTLYSAYSLDYRQVIFGNSYENIIEIDADDFFEQYPAVKEYNAGSNSSITTYAHIYEQIIGETTFYRVLFSDEELTEADFLDWEDIFFRQYVFLKKSDTNLLQIGDDYEFGYEMATQRGTYRLYSGFAVIERNNQVIGIMRDRLSQAFYCLWADVLQYEEKISPTISYVNWQNNPSIPEIVISSRGALSDGKRPFMYTLQNAFDGNPATSYVESTYYDTFSLSIWLKGSRYTEFPECTSYKIINGYASGDYYHQNNQIAKINAGYFRGSKHISRGSVQLKDTLKPQVINFEVMKDDAFYMQVEEITKGTLYNDTCLAEFDIYFEGEGWLFGSSDTDTIVASPTITSDYKYAIEDGNAEITLYRGEETEVTIPSSMEHQGKTYTVTSIGERAFSGSRLTSITIPASVTSIGEHAFSKSTLTSVNIYGNNTSIGNYAFLECKNLLSVNISGSVTSIGNYAFSKCESLISVNISGSAISIGEGAFADTGLTSIVIPNGVTSLGVSVFSYSSSLASVTIPDSVTSIGGMAFAGCGSLTSITIPDSVTFIGASAFGGTGLTSITIPDSLTFIGYGTFADCSNLTSISIPDSVTSIGEIAFIESGLISVTIPDSVTSIDMAAFNNCENLTSVIIPNSVTSIGDGVFAGCENLTLSVFPDSYALSYAERKDIPYTLLN